MNYCWVLKKPHTPEFIPEGKYHLQQGSCNRVSTWMERNIADLSQVILKYWLMRTRSTHLQSCTVHGRGVSCAYPVVALKEEILQSVYTHYPFWRCKWTRSQIRNHLHAFILARADILEIQTQGHPKQAAAINMQIKLWIYYGLAGCQDIHTISAQAAILNVRAEFKWWTSFNKACCILGNHKNEQNKFRNFLLNQEYFPSTASKVGNQVIQQWRFLWFVSSPPALNEHASSLKARNTNILLC